MTANQPRNVLEHTLTACWICRRFLRKTSKGSLCKRCEQRTRDASDKRPRMQGRMIPLVELAIREKRIDAHRERVGKEMQRRGVIQGPWWEQPIPECVRLKVELPDLEASQLQLREKVQRRDQGDEFDRIRRRDVTRALAKFGLNPLESPKSASQDRVGRVRKTSKASGHPVKGGVS